MAKPEFEDIARLLMAGAIERQPAFWPRRSMWTMASMARAPADVSQLCRWCRWPQRFMWTMASITRAAAVATPLCCWYCWCGVSTIVKLSIWVASRLCDCNATSRLKSVWIRKFFFYGLREINRDVAKNPTVELYSLDVRIVRQNFFSRKADGVESASFEGVTIGIVTWRKILW